MRRVDVSPEADIELEDLLVYSASRFGLAAAVRYRALIYQAFRDLADDSSRPGAGKLKGVSNDLLIYPIRHSRNRVLQGRVHQARHVIAFRFDESRIEIVHLLHDAMDLPGRLG